MDFDNSTVTFQTDRTPLHRIAMFVGQRPTRKTMATTNAGPSRAHQSPPGGLWPNIVAPHLCQGTILISRGVSHATFRLVIYKKARYGVRARGAGDNKVRRAGGEGLRVFASHGYPVPK